MEKTKRTLLFTTVSSLKDKKDILNVINEAIARYSDDETVSLIPTDPIPNVSFWVNNENKTFGISIKRENCKWGWMCKNDEFLPCSYMTGWGIMNVKFNSNENEYLKEKLDDYCYKIKK